MNVELPDGIKSVQVLRLEPGDILVLRCAHKMSQHELMGVSEQLGTMFPGVQCAILDPDMKFQVVRSGVEAPAHALGMTLEERIIGDVESLKREAANP